MRLLHMGLLWPPEAQPNVARGLEGGHESRAPVSWFPESMREGASPGAAKGAGAALGWGLPSQLGFPLLSSAARELSRREESKEGQRQRRDAPLTLSERPSWRG